jgi:hypothetical protein
MTAPLRHPVAAARIARVDTLKAFQLRRWARATLWAAGEFGLHEAVDVLQCDAERDGLITRIGQDAVQRIMADAFHSFRNMPEVPTNWADVAREAWDAPSWRDAAIEYHKERGSRISLLDEKPER